MPYISLEPPQRMTSYRTLAVSTWRHPRDPTTYAALDIPADNAEAFLANVPGPSAPTLTHFVLIVMAHCLNQYPHLNHVLRCGRLYRRASVDAFITTMVRSADQKDLAGFVVRNVNDLGLEGLTVACDEGVQALRKDEDVIAAERVR